MQLSGYFFYMLDDKGRLIMPKELRSGLVKGKKNTLVMSLSPLLDCIRIYPLEKWNSIMAKVRVFLEDETLAPETALFYKNLCFGIQSMISIDSSGRILLPQKLRNMAGIKQEKNIFVIGQDDYVEIWSQSQWLAKIEQMRAGAKYHWQFANKLGL